MERSTPMRPCGQRWPTEEAARHSKKALAGDALENGELELSGCPCGGWHLRAAERPRAPLTARRRDTGPDRDTRDAVWARDLGCCAGCGHAIRSGLFSIQHRDARGAGGARRPEANSPENLVLLCGTATMPGMCPCGCHLKCEQRDPVMHARGLWLETGEDPAAKPVIYATPSGPAEYLLTPDAARTPVDPEGVSAA
jgi:hypothetical protein